MMRSQHYRAAQQLLRDIDHFGSAYRTDIPNLLLALTHAVLATADLEVETSATSSTAKGKPA